MFPMFIKNTKGHVKGSGMGAFTTRRNEASLSFHHNHSKLWILQKKEKKSINWYDLWPYSIAENVIARKNSQLLHILSDINQTWSEACGWLQTCFIDLTAKLTQGHRDTSNERSNLQLYQMPKKSHVNVLAYYIHAKLSTVTSSFYLPLKKKKKKKKKKIIWNEQIYRSVYGDLFVWPTINGLKVRKWSNLNYLLTIKTMSTCWAYKRVRSDIFVRPTIKGSKVMSDVIIMSVIGQMQVLNIS